MAVAIGDVVRASVRFTNSFSGDVMNVWYAQLSGSNPVSDSDVMDALDTAIETIYTHIRSHIHGSTQPFDIKYDVVDNVGGKETVTQVLGTRTFTMTLPPNGSGDALPAMDSMIVNFRTAIPRSFGRKFFGVIPEPSQGEGRVESATVTALAALVTEVLTPIAVGVAESLDWGVFSLLAASAPDWFNQFTAGIINDVIGTRKSRRLGVGS